MHFSFSYSTDKIDFFKSFSENYLKQVHGEQCGYTSSDLKKIEKFINTHYKLPVVSYAIQY